MIPIDIPSLRKLLADANLRSEIQHGVAGHDADGCPNDMRAGALCTPDVHSNIVTFDGDDIVGVASIGHKQTADLVIGAVNALGPLLDRIEAQQAFIKDALTCVAARGDACFAARHCTIGEPKPAEGPRSSDHEESKQSKEKK